MIWLLNAMGLPLESHLGSLNFLFVLLLAIMEKLIYYIVIIYYGVYLSSINVLGKKTHKRSSKVMVTESYEPEFTTVYGNDSFIIYGPKNKINLKNNKKNKLSSYKMKTKQMKTNARSVFSGKMATSKLMKIGQALGRIPILKRGVGVNCWEDIGCFSAFDTKEGRIGMLPLSPDEIDMTFHVYTTVSTNKSFELKYNFNTMYLRQSKFNYTHQTVLIIHGFKSGLSKWMLDIKDMLYQLKYIQYNVILVDWVKGANISVYGLAASNTQVVGALMAHFINRICEHTYDFKIKNDMFYLIGHSLGAQASGYAGKRLFNPKLARITGLDPAGTIFEYYPPNGQLYYTDAAQVDIIHTDLAENALTTGFGIGEAIGDIDFYPNGGKLQPGCPMTKMIETLVRYPDDVSCSHSRAWALGVAFGDVKDMCQPLGYMCEHWETFLEGRCARCQKIGEFPQCQLMGLYPTFWKTHAIPKKRTVFHYQIAFHTSPESDLKSTGQFNITLTGKVKNETKIINTNRLLTNLQPGRIHTILITFRHIFKVEELTINWMKFKKFKNKGQVLKITFIEVNYMSHINQKTRKQQSVQLCPVTDGILVIDKEGNEFATCEQDFEAPHNLATDPQSDLVPLTSSKDILFVDAQKEDALQRKLFRNKFTQY